MTSRGYNPTFQKTPYSYSLDFSFPAAQEERLRKSLENLPLEISDDEVTDVNDVKMDDLPPDYGDDSMYDHFQTRSSGDLSDLPQLTEAAILDVVRTRYQQDRIYTSCGDVLISVNPFKELPIFDEETHGAYSGDVLSQEQDPHVFWTASQATARRMRDKSDQVVLVTGESGAGKTEATKLMLKHILHLSSSRQDRLYESIDKVNPLIELFGNARTVLNDNSSRFAKFLDVRFTDDAVSGAIIRDYILEKSRVVKPPKKESNFHIFYTFLEDVLARPDLKRQFLMEGMTKNSFSILPESSWQRNDSRMSTSEQTSVFRQIGITQEEVENLHIILAGILHLTNIRFMEDSGFSGGVFVEDETTMNKAAALLSVDPEMLVAVLVTTKRIYHGEEMQVFKSKGKAEESRDAIAKALYERLFGWLIRRINTALNRKHSTQAGIGFLDICGFEDVKSNSLEQMCINLANEHLQKFLYSHVFDQEMKIYRHEGIELGDVTPPNNVSILQMFDAPRTGILALINEDTWFEQANNAAMVMKLISQHKQSDHFLRHKNEQPFFGIHHFAGPVWYNADQFLEKNGDALTPEVKDLMVVSSNELISDIFQVEKAPTGSIAPTHFNYRVSQKHDIRFPQQGQVNLSETLVRGLKQSLRDRFGQNIPQMESAGRRDTSSQKTVIDYFQCSMKELLKKIGDAHPLFVRCIKPNDQQAPDCFDDKKVNQQLIYNGVTQMAAIRRVWFSVRTPITQFIAKYCCLAPGAETIPEKRQAVNTIVQRLGIPAGHYRTGNTLIFLKDEASARLEQCLRKHKAEEERRKKEEEERKKKEEAARKKVISPESKINSAAKPILKKQPSILKPSKMDSVEEVDTPFSSIRTDLPFGPATSTSSMNMSEAESTDSSSPEQMEPIPPQDEFKDNPNDPKNSFWDIFRIVSREAPATDIHHMTAMKIIKVIAYCFIFLIVLASATAHKVSLVLILSASNQTTQGNQGSPAALHKQKASEAYYILLLVAICLPYILNFLTSLAKVLFGGFKNPSSGTWIWVFISESLHTFGITLLTLYVLPRVGDALHKLLLLTAVGTIPSVLKVVSSVDVKRRRHNIFTVLNYVLDTLAMAGQLSVFPVMYLLNYSPLDKNETLLLQLAVAGAMFFVSISSWENFMDGRFFVQLKDMNPFKNFLLKRRFELERGRHFPLLVTSVWKIVLTVVLAYVFRGHRDFDYRGAFDVLKDLKDELKAISAIIVLTISAFVCYYASYIACKLWMQIVSFSMPLLLATPCAVLVFYLDRQYNGFLADVSTAGGESTKLTMFPSELASHWTTLVPGVAWFISLMILTRHIWFPRQSRLAKIELLFMNPLYCGVLTTEALLLNRRRHALSCRKKRIPVDSVNTDNEKSAKKVIYVLDTKEHKNSKDGDYAGGSELYTEINEVEGYASGQTVDTVNPYGTGKKHKADEDTPMIYACATMWHEVRREMVALLKSLHRLDREQWIRKQAQELSKTKDSDYFEYEAHIFFDDAMTLDDDEEVVPNDYVTLLVDVMEEAVSSVYHRTMRVLPPIKIPTPYGGQLLWEMPGGNMLFVHLKDKAKIRHRKRWSQVMYMYYLLGFRLTRQCEQKIIEALKSGGVDPKSRWLTNRENVVGSDIFEMLDEYVSKKSQNTFVMALDGDTDFSPGSVHILLDRMKKNPKVGAACGRIHPIGSGPMVWYQMFEYAIGHWMQKATEHVLGCVLCSPGCFSLFRGSALMDDNVMKKYSILPTEPGHYLQYDQGEDRWLCTLLLQQGYRVDYAAAADSWTYCPEGFNEFFNQRRRWMPSTLANVMDLLADYSNTVAVNSNISMLYIVYQVALMVATIIGPGTVIMMISGAIEVVFNVDLIWSYVISLIPTILYLIVCLYCKSQVQLYLAAFLSTFYAFVMMIVFTGTIIIAVEESIFHPSVVVVVLLIIIFVVAGLFHPLELYCLPSGALYLLCVPSGYLLLVIYSLCNLHVVSWGTREAPKKMTKAEIEQEAIEAKKKEEEKAKKKGFFSRFFFSSYLNDLKEIILSMTGVNRKQDDTEDKTIKLLEQINENLIKLSGGRAAESGEHGSSAVHQKESSHQEPKSPASDPKVKRKRKKSVKIDRQPEHIKPVRNELENPKWIEDKGVGDGEVMKLFDEELQFWQVFIHRYLKPLDADKKKEEEVSKSLIELRNSVCFGVGMINLLWIAINFMFQLRVPVTVDINIGKEAVKVGILGLLFVFFLLAILLLQIIGMIIHRWGTLLHLLAFTDIKFPCLSKRVSGMADKKNDFRKAFEFCEKMMNEPMPDYLGEEDEGAGADLGQTLKDRWRETIVGSRNLQRQTVVERLNQAGMMIEPDWVNSPEVDLYLRGTQRATGEDDPDSRQFVENFRSNVFRGSRPASFPNGGIGSYGSGAPSDGFAPAIPRRQTGGGVRRRLGGNNLRYTVRDAIDRARAEGIQVAQEDTSGRDGRGGIMGGAYGGFPGAFNDRAFGRRLQMFNEYTSGPGRQFSRRYGSRDQEHRARFNVTAVDMPDERS